MVFRRVFTFVISAAVFSLTVFSISLLCFLMSAATRAWAILKLTMAARAFSVLDDQAMKAAPAATRAVTRRRMTLDLHAILNRRICAVARIVLPRMTLMAAARRRYTPLSVVTVDAHAVVTTFAIVVCAIHARKAALSTVMLTVRAVTATVRAAVALRWVMSHTMHCMMPIFMEPKASAAFSFSGRRALPSSSCRFCRVVVFCAARSAAEIYVSPASASSFSTMEATLFMKLPVCFVFSEISAAERPRLSRIMGDLRPSPVTMESTI